MSRPHLGKPCKGCGKPYGGSGKHGMCLSCGTKAGRAKEKKSESYSAVHQWLHANFGKVDRCENQTCPGKAKRFEWANLWRTKYERKRENFIRLCASCHRLYDKKKLILALHDPTL